MFSNGHVTVMSSLFLQYDPSANPKNSVCLVWKVGKVLTHSSECQFFLLFSHSKMATCDQGFEANLERSYS